MINTVLQGIVDALYNLYGGTVPIYTMQQKQGFEAPCFFIDVVDSQLVQELRNRYIRNITFQVSYITSLDDGDSIDYKDLYKQAPVLELGLETLILRNGDKIRGDDISSTVDDALHVTVTYPVFFYVPDKKEEYMEQLIQSQHTKG